jgi:hypothetical protein
MGGGDVEVGGQSRGSGIVVGCAPAACAGHSSVDTPFASHGTVALLCAGGSWAAAAATAAAAAAAAAAARRLAMVGGSTRFVGGAETRLRLTPATVLAAFNGSTACGSCCPSVLSPAPCWAWSRVPGASALLDGAVEATSATAPATSATDASEWLMDHAIAYCVYMDVYCCDGGGRRCVSVPLGSPQHARLARTSPPWRCRRPRRKCIHTPALSSATN